MNVSKKFLTDFQIVTEYYEFTEEEIQDAKAAVRKDYELAKEGFASMAHSIKVIMHCSDVIGENNGC